MQLLMLQLLQLFILIGLPLIAFALIVKYQTRGQPSDLQIQKKKQEEEDKAYLAAYGPAAFTEMLKNRKLHNPAFFDKIATAPNSGILYSKLTPHLLLNNIKLNKDNFSGSPPVCFEHFATDTVNYKVTFEGQWPNPAIEKWTTTLTLTIILAGMPDGRTAVKYAYKADPDIDQFATQLIQISTSTLKQLCEFK